MQGFYRCWFTDVHCSDVADNLNALLLRVDSHLNSYADPNKQVYLMLISSLFAVVDRQKMIAKSGKHSQILFASPAHFTLSTHASPVAKPQQEGAWLRRMRNRVLLRFHVF